MTHIEINNHSVLILEIPETEHGFGIIPARGGSSLSVFIEHGFPLPVEKINLPEGNWSILGTINKKEEVSFDCEPYVRKINEGKYHHYGEPETMYCTDAKSSFISLLNSHGIYINNPIGEKPEHDDFKRYPLPICFDRHQEQSSMNLRSDSIQKNMNAWESYQSKTLKDNNQLLILIKK